MIEMMNEKCLPFFLNSIVKLNFFKREFLTQNLEDSRYEGVKVVLEISEIDDQLDSQRSPLESFGSLLTYSLQLKLDKALKPGFSPCRNVSTY